MAKENKKKTVMWLAAAALIAAAIIIIWVVITRETAQAPEENEEVKIEKDEDDMSGWKTYENREYDFSFKYPGEWENIIEKNIDKPEGSKIYKSIRLLSKADSDYYIQFQIVKIEDKNDDSVKDYPHTFITEDKKYAFYYTISGDCLGMPECEDKKFKKIQGEIEKIISTFLKEI